MDSRIRDIERILTEEREIFARVCALEEKKTTAIIDQKGREMEKISLEQESLLMKIEGHETRRMALVKDIQKRMNPSAEGEITLKELASSQASASADTLMKLGQELKAIMQRLEKLRDTNVMLINDNMEYYQIMLQGLRGGASNQFYGTKGKKKEKVSHSILINKKA